MSGRKDKGKIKKLDFSIKICLIIFPVLNGLGCDSHQGVQILRTLGFVDRNDGGACYCIKIPPDPPFSKGGNEKAKGLDSSPVAQNDKKQIPPLISVLEIDYQDLMDAVLVGKSVQILRTLSTVPHFLRGKL